MRLSLSVRRARPAVLAGSLLFGGASFTVPAPERVAINDNRASAGTLVDGVLTVRLDARAGDWHPDADSDHGVTIRAFAADGGPLQNPAPLLRVPQGTEIRAFVHNSIPGERLIMHGLNTRGSSVPGNDTVSIGEDETREIRFTASQVGTFFYWASTGTRPMPGAREGLDSQLSGAFIVDSRNGPRQSDRIILMSLWQDRVLRDTSTRLARFVMNGKSWPNTERLSYRIGDTVHFRLINAGIGIHPMHLHGFYYNIDSRGTEQADSLFAAKPTHLANTERLPGAHTFSLTWVPTRPGNWLFHCHDPIHIQRREPLDLADTMTPDGPHDMMDMRGLVMGISVVDPTGTTAAVLPAPKRKLRLIAAVDSGGTPAEPSYGYILDDGRPLAKYPRLPGPTLVLKQGEPVSITIVNHLPEPTSIHWHGIELDSYYDGVPGFDGHPGHLAPEIAPGDSFVARFTPPRAGTFMYHPHVNEVRQQKAGLDGALVVIGSTAHYNPATDLGFLTTTPRLEKDANVGVLLNGSATPAARDLRVGVKYRIRLMNLHNFRPSMIFRIMRDTSTLTWRAIAKDGMNLPAGQATVGPSARQLGNGETCDFEFTPTARGTLHFDVTAANGKLLVSMPLRISLGPRGPR